MDKQESKVVNFGCRLNSYESEFIKSQLSKNKIKNTIVFNTCAVTHEAERQIQQAIRKYKKNNPKMKIVITGCASQINPNKYYEMEEVDSVIGNNEKTKGDTWKNFKSLQNIHLSDIMKVNKTNKNIVENFSNKVRAYIEIQQGCNHRCTFCIIPFGRGNNRSVPINVIIQRARKLVSRGFNEIVLTGVDITNYGTDLPGNLSLTKMIRCLLKYVPNLKQLRLSSIDCGELDSDFFDLIKFEERLMPHLHIRLQSGDDLILKRMKRRHTFKTAVEFCEKIKNIRPNLVFGADLIAGFPTETEKMFNNTCNLINECDLVYLHVFPFSKRDGTAAAKMPQVPNIEKKYRSKILRDIGNKKLSDYLKSVVGEKKVVLIEKNFDNFSLGKTPEYASLKINKILKVGELINLKINSENNNMLVA